MAGCRPLTSEEVALVLASFDGPYASRNKCLFTTGIRTGFRINELLSLRVQDVEQHGKILDRIHVEARFMKGRRRGRTIVLHRQAQEAIAAYLDDYEKKWGRRMAPEMCLFRSQIGVNRKLSRSHEAQVSLEIYTRHQLRGVLGSHAQRKTYAQTLWTKFEKGIVKLRIRSNR